MDFNSLSSIDVILASQASWRSEILKQNNVDHRCFSHKYDEPKFVEGSLSVFVENIAREKAKSLEKDFRDSMIIAADQLISIEGEVLYKSGSREKAIRQLGKLNGKCHQLICAVAVLFRGEMKSQTETATLEMRKLENNEITTYVDFDKPWDCAGSYKIESLGASLFKSISAADPTTIIGLPSNLMIDLIREFGFSNLI